MIPPLFGKQEVGIWRVQKHFPRYGVPIWSLWPNIRFLPSIVAEKIATKNEHIQCMFNVYKNQLSRQTGSRNMTGPKTLPTIWYTYMTKNILDGRTEVKQYTPSPFRERGYNYSNKSLKVRLSNNYRNA